MTNHLILIAEDNDEDFVTFQRALLHNETKARVERCKKGDEVLDYFYQRGRFVNQPLQLPALILLDLNLPGLDGRHVLTYLKQDVRLKSLPIVVVTTSTNPQDIAVCYSAGANSYLVKSFRFQQFREHMKALIEYWFNVVTLPIQGEEA